MKKTLTIILSLAMVLCMLPQMAFAQTTITDGMVTLGSTSVTYSGSGFEPIVTVKDGNKTLIESTDYDKRVLNGNTPVNNPADVGTYTVEVSGKGEYTGVVKKNYEIKKLNLASSDVTVSITGGELWETEIANWNSIQPGGTVTLPAGKQIEVRAGSTIIPEAHYDKVATKINDSSIAVKVSSNNANTNIEGSRYTNVDVKRTLAGYEVRINTNQQYVYTGKAIEPTVYVVPIGSSSNYGVLTQNVDFKVTYKSNINAGQATVEVTGISKYSGTLTGNFNIVPKTISGVSVTASAAVQGGRPSLIVKDGENTLAEGTDYIVSNVNSNQVGVNKGTLNINGTGNYKESKQVNFNVADANHMLNDCTVITYVQGNKFYSGNALYPPVKAVIRDKSNIQLVENSDYVLEYRANINGVAVSTRTPKDAGQYQVFAVGLKYGGEINAGAFIINQLPFRNTAPDYPITVNVTAGSDLYNPSVTVKITASGIVLKQGTDYTVSRPYVIANSGKANVTIHSVGNNNIQQNSITVPYSLSNKSLSYCTAYFVGQKNTAPYTGNLITIPEVMVYDGSTKLIRGTHYTVQYKDSLGRVVSTVKDAGKYTVVLTGTGMYTGTKELVFEVVGNSIENYVVKLKENMVMADGTNKQPVVESVTLGNKTLYQADYTVSYQDSTGKNITSMKLPGVYKVIVTGRNSYSGSCYASFRIKGLDQTVTPAQKSYLVYANGETAQVSATASGDGTGFIYESSDTSVATVDAKGIVTPHKMGRAVITISTTGTVKYDPAKAKVVIKVYPNKGKITRKPWRTGKSGQIRVRWEKQDNATRYEIMYCRNSKFHPGTFGIKSVGASQSQYTTQSRLLSGLARGQKYYIKVRVVKEVKNDYGKTLTYYGEWSTWRSVVVK